MTLDNEVVNFKEGTCIKVLPNAVRTMEVSRVQFFAPKLFIIKIADFIFIFKITPILFIKSVLNKFIK